MEAGAAEGGAQGGGVDGDDGLQAGGAVLAQHDLLVAALLRPEQGVQTQAGRRSTSVTVVTPIVVIAAEDALPVGWGGPVGQQSKTCGRGVRSVAVIEESRPRGSGADVTGRGRDSAADRLEEAWLPWRVGASSRTRRICGSTSRWRPFPSRSARTGPRYARRDGVPDRPGRTAPVAGGLAAGPAGAGAGRTRARTPSWPRSTGCCASAPGGPGCAAGWRWRSWSERLPAPGAGRGAAAGGAAAGGRGLRALAGAQPGRPPVDPYGALAGAGALVRALRGRGAGVPKR